MTREEQIDWLCRLRSDLNNGVIFTPWNKEFTEALTGALEQEPCENWYDIPSEEITLEQARSAVRELREKLGKCMFTPTCEDAISRQAVLDVAEESILDLEYISENIEFCNQIKALPSVTPTRKKGKWTKLSDIVPCVNCPLCGKTFTLLLGGDEMNYCPNCGAKMGGAENDD